MDTARKKECEEISLKIAKKYLRFEFSGAGDDTTFYRNSWCNYHIYAERSGIPDNLRSEIEEVVNKKRSKFLPSDVYRYW